VYNANQLVSIDPFHAPICKPVQLLAASCGLAVVFLGVMRSLHNGLETITDCSPNADLAKERWAMAWRFGCGVFHFTVPFYGLAHPIENAGIHLALLAVMLILEVRFGPKEEGSDDGSEGEGHHSAVDTGTEIEERASRLSGFMGSQRMPLAPHMQRFPPHSAAAMMHKDPRAMEMLNYPAPPGRPPRNPLENRPKGRPFHHQM